MVTTEAADRKNGPLPNPIVWFRAAEVRDSLRGKFVVSRAGEV
jgi:hypothetical protein